MKFSEVSLKLKKDWSRRVKEGSLSKITLSGYLDRLKRAESIFGKRILCLIKQSDILEDRAETAAKLSNVTSNRELFVIKQVFKKGVALHAVREDLASPISYLSEKDNERDRFLFPKEIEELVKAAGKTRAKYYLPPIIFLGAEHGASKQEILSLRWSKVDFDYRGEGMITLYRTKNKKKRTEVFMPRTRQALLDWKNHLERSRKKRRISPKSDYVFCRIDGTPLKEFKKAWKQILELCGIKNFHFHDLRHTYCSNLLLAGSNLKDVKEMIGHRDISMTDRYSHLTFEHKRLQQVRLSEHYSKI